MSGPLLTPSVRARRGVAGAAALVLGASTLLAATTASAAVPPVPARLGGTVAAVTGLDLAGTAAVTPVAKLRVTLTRKARGLVNPVLVRSAPEGRNRLYVVEQAGRIRIVSKGKVTGTYLDIRGVVSSGGEQGLLGLAFAPDFARSRYLWVTYTRGDGALVVARFRAASATASRVSATTRRTVLVVPHPGASNHNGGDIAFGPDGYLYLGTGDGGSGGDPNGNAPNRRSLLGKMLRIDVRCAKATYCIPASNPYATSTTLRREIWMSGLRNPWRWSFDTDGTQWVADVGQDRYEEVSVVPKGRARGADLGWSCREGTHSFNGSRCVSGRSYVAPSIELCHPDHVAGCRTSRSGESVIGGYVYRGSRIPSARGTYVFADFITGLIWPYRGGVVGTPTARAGITGFGLADGKEIYAVTYSGDLLRVGFRTV